MYRKRYKSGERTFIVDTTKISDGYYPVTDADSKVIFKLPTHVIESKQYIFSWDRYVEERDNDVLQVALQCELERLKGLEKSPNVIKGIEDMKKFLLHTKD